MKLKKVARIGGTHRLSILFISAIANEARLLPAGVRSLACLCIMFMLCVGAKAERTTTCHPLLVLIEGGTTSTDGNSMEELFLDLDKQYDVSAVIFDNKYFGSGVQGVFLRENNQNYSTISDMLTASSFWPVVIVGHSLGGAAAYLLAKQAPSVLLVTLDAVASPDEVKHPGVRWVNVYAKNAPQILQMILPIPLMWRGDSALAEDWEHEDHADINVKIRWIDHGDVKVMFEKARTHLDPVLFSCPKKPKDFKRDVDARRLWEFCSDNDDVNCKFSSHFLP